MYSQYHHGVFFCPVCARIITERLRTVANQSFDLPTYLSAPGAHLEFQLRGRPICDDPGFPPAIDLAGLIEINGNAVPVDSVDLYESEHFAISLLGRLNLDPWITPGSPATVVFKRRPSSDGETDLWIPGIQIVNDEGARYFMHPTGAALIQQLHGKHAPECDYEHWDLADGDLTLVFTPNSGP